MSISPKTLFVFANAKLLGWAASMIFFGAEFQHKNQFFFIGDYPLTKYLMLASAILGFANLFWYRSRIIYLIVSLILCFLSAYVCIGFGVSSDWTGSSFFRTLVETGFIMYMVAKIISRSKSEPIE